MLPGCDFIQGVDQVPPDWVALYKRDLMNDVAHLYEGDIEDYLDDHHPGWRDQATLSNAGHHWNVTLNRPPLAPLVVTTVADGNCGAHAAHAVRHADAIIASPGMANNYAAPRTAITAIRSAVQTSIGDDVISARIFDEVHNADNVFETGFGPLLMEAIQKRDKAYDPKGKDADDALAQWSTDSNMTVTGPLGLQFNAKHNRGAPFLTAGPSSSMVDKPKKMESYESWLREINASGVDQKIVAQYLRVKDPDDLLPLAKLLKTQQQRAAVSMMWQTVYLAEEWRKSGAAKIFRALMRAVEAGEADLQTAVMQGFRFRASADEGRTQVGLVQDHLAGIGDPSEADIKEATSRPPRGEKLTNEKKRKRDAIRRKAKPIQTKWAKTVVAHISDGEEDLSSDDEMAERRKLNKKRKLSDKHAESDK